MKIFINSWIILAFVSNLTAASFTVTTTNDTGAGSLRDTILAANAATGPHTIAFNIAGGALTIFPASELPEITEPILLDASTQPGYVDTPLIELNGALLTTGSPDGLRILAGHSTVRGLHINRFRGDCIELAEGGTNLIEGTILGLNSSGNDAGGTTRNGILITNSSANVIGSTNVNGRNVISGNNINGIHIVGTNSTGNQIRNNIVGLDVTGTNARGNSGNGVLIDGASGNLIGGTSPAERNILSGNFSDGVELFGAAASDNLIVGNFIGTDITGTVDRGNSGDGVFVNNAGGNQIGGSAVGRGNLISGNNSEGITFSGSNATNNLVQGNLIGTDASGTNPLRNNSHGVQLISSASNNSIGGEGVGEGNVIAYNGSSSSSDGVYVNSGVGNAIRGNSIFENSGLGIDLGSNGVTPNDTDDTDNGANLQQNFPVISGATNHGASSDISGALHSAANTEFRLDFFANQAFDPTLYGEGEFYLGSHTVTTDGSGNVDFSVTLPAGLSGRYVTATATDPNGNTSEFSPVKKAQSGLPAASFTVLNVNDHGTGSLRQAILNANGAITAGPDLIDFNIPGPGPHIIAPTSSLPAIVDAVIIDAVHAEQCDAEHPDLRERRGFEGAARRNQPAFEHRPSHPHCR